MPNFPRYESQRMPNAQLSGPTLSGAGEQIEKMAAPAKAAATMMEEMNKLNDSMQYINAKTNFDSQSSKIIAEATAEVDYNKAQEYIGKLEKLRDESLSGIKNQMNAQKTAIQIDHDLQMARINVSSIFRKKQVEMAQVQFTQQMKNFEKKRYWAVSQQEVGAVNEEIRQFVETAVSGGLIDQSIAQKAMNTYTENVRKGIPLNDLSANPEGFLEAVKENLYDLTPKEKEEYTEKAKSLIRKRKWQQDQEVKAVQGQTAINMAKGLIDGSLSLPAVEDALVNGTIDPETATALIDGISGVATPKDTRTAQTYLNAIEGVVFDSDSVSKLIENATRALNKGNIDSRQEYAFFIEKARDIVNPATIEATQWQRAFRNTIASINRIAKSGVFQSSIMKSVMENNGLFRTGALIWTLSGAYKVDGYTEDGQPLVRKVD